MFHLRVQLPDRPGSLGAVATAMGQVGADIASVEIIEKGEGFAINDFILALPPDVLPDSLITECGQLDGVRVMWMSRVADRWRMDSDIDALNQMVRDPVRALEVLAQVVPQVFNCQWAVVMDPQGHPRHATELAPELGADQLELLQPFDQSHAAELAAEWAPNWSDTAVAVVPAARDHVLVAGRSGGPIFLDSEVRRLQHLAAMA